MTILSTLIFNSIFLAMGEKEKEVITVVTPDQALIQIDRQDLPDFKPRSTSPTLVTTPGALFEKAYVPMLEANRAVRKANERLDGLSSEELEQTRETAQILNDQFSKTVTLHALCRKMVKDNFLNASEVQRGSFSIGDLPLRRFLKENLASLSIPKSEWYKYDSLEDDLRKTQNDVLLFQQSISVWQRSDPDWKKENPKVFCRTMGEFQSLLLQHLDPSDAAQILNGYLAEEQKEKPLEQKEDAA